MIVCHCSLITDTEILDAVKWMRTADPDTIITPGKIYNALGKRADCGGCLPVFMETMQKSDSLGVPVLTRGRKRGIAGQRRQK